MDMGEGGNLLRALRERLAASEFHTWAGMDVVAAAKGEVTVAMDVLDRHLNLQGLVHGGMLAILADTACGLSIRSAMEAGRLHVTTDMDIHYLAPAKPGRIFGRGKAIRVGRSLAFAEASIEDAEGKLLARAQSRFSVSGRETAPG
jgi:acyl-CoA thioesterase